VFRHGCLITSDYQKILTFVRVDRYTKRCTTTAARHHEHGPDGIRAVWFLAAGLDVKNPPLDNPGELFAARHGPPFAFLRRHARLTLWLAKPEYNAGLRDVPRWPARVR
jgi:hypothetical protein